MDRLAQTVTRRGQMAGDPRFSSNRTVTDRNIPIILNGLQKRLLQSIAHLLFTETNLPVGKKKKSHITLIMTPVPDGAGGKSL